MKRPPVVLSLTLVLSNIATTSAAVAALYFHLNRTIVYSTRYAKTKRIIDQ